MLPDSQVLWVIPALARLRRIIAKYEPEAIIATAPPYSVLLLGLLAKRLARKPLVSDFRDPWSEYLLTLRRHENSFRKRIEASLEKKVLRGSDSVLCPTPGMISYFQTEICPNQKYELIYNGFDDDDFADITPRKFSKFSFVYTGEVNSSFHSALPFVKAFRELVRRKPQLKKRVIVHFVGEFNDEEAVALMEQPELNEIIVLDGYLPHRECLSYQMGADVLLLFLNSDAGESITGKLFEYLRARKKILALAPRDSMAGHLLRSINTGIVIPPDETERIVTVLEKLITADTHDYNSDYDYSQFSRKGQTGKLARILDEVIG